MSTPESLEQQLREAEDARQRAEFRAASLFTRLAQTEDSVAEARKELAEERQRLAAEQARAGELEARVRGLETVIKDIHGSTSWKASYPIRWAKRLVRS